MNKSLARSNIFVKIAIFNEDSLSIRNFWDVWGGQFNQVALIFNNLAGNKLDFPEVVVELKKETFFQSVLNKSRILYPKVYVCESDILSREDSKLIFHL